MSSLTPSPENLRVEIARYGVSRKRIRELTGLHVNSISNAVCEVRPLRPWMAHNLGWAINTITGRRVFDVDMSKGVLPEDRKVRQAGVAAPPPLLPTRRQRRFRKRAS